MHPGIIAPRAKVLLVSANETLVGHLVERCAKHGLDAFTAATLTAAGLALAQWPIEAIALESVKRSQWEYCQEIRSVPTLILGPRNPYPAVTAPECLNVLKYADDYLGEPFAERECVARLLALVRRFRWTAQEVITQEQSAQDRWDVKGPDLVKIFDWLYLEPPTHRVYLNQQLIYLTKREHQVFALLAYAGGKLVSYGELMHKVWGENDEEIHRDNLRVYIAYLRRKLPQGNIFIKTRPNSSRMPSFTQQGNFGYYLDPRNPFEDVPDDSTPVAAVVGE